MGMNALVGWLPLELATLKCLAEFPVGIGNVVRDYGLAVTGGCHEGERLAIQNRTFELPILAPVLPHWHPPVQLGRHHRHLLHIPGSSHVCDQHQQEPWVAVDGEAQSSLSHTCYPVTQQQQHPDKHTHTHTHNRQAHENSCRSVSGQPFVAVPVLVLWVTTRL